MTKTEIINKLIDIFFPKYHILIDDKYDYIHIYFKTSLIDEYGVSTYLDYKILNRCGINDLVDHIEERIRRAKMIDYRKSESGKVGKVNKDFEEFIDEYFEYIIWD